MLKINHIEYYLPKNRIQNKDVFKLNPDWDLEFLTKKTGVLNRFYTDIDETALDIANKACEAFFEKNESVKSKIDGLIFCTQSNDYIMPPNSSLLHGMLNLSEQVLAFDFNLACSGYIYGLALANGLIKTKVATNILMINADTYSKYINDSDRSSKLLFGDAAAVTHLNRSDDGKGLIDIICSTSGINYRKFIIPAGGMRKPKSNETKLESKDKSGNIRNQEEIHMDGLGIFSFVNAKVPKQVLEILKRNQYEIENIDLFVFHQASKLALESLTKILKIEPDKVYINIDKIGNTVSASIPIALKDAQEEGKIKNGYKVLCSGFGVGLSWGTCILQF